MLRRSHSAAALQALLLCLLAAGASASPFPLKAVGTRLVDAQGRDFHIVGDAPWALIVGLTLGEADAYLAARKAAGFNTILVELIERQRTGPRNRNGDPPFPDDRPFAGLSPAYFRHASAVLDLALKHDFLVLLAPAYLGNNCGRNGWCNQMLATPDAVLEEYGRQVASLLAPYPNILWVHGGDVDARRFDVLGKVEAVYRGIDAVVPGALHTGHCSRNFSGVDCYDRPWLNVNTTYSDCEQTPARVRLDQRRVTGMPSLYIEGRYEEEKSTPSCIRAQLWWSYLAGSVGHVFGNKRIWLFAPGWPDALDTPGTRAMTVASRLLDRLRAANDRLLPVASGKSPLAVDTSASAWARVWEPSYPLSLAWRTSVDGPDGIPVAMSPMTTIAFVPYRTRFRYTGGNDVLCWIDTRNGAIRRITGAPARIQSPDANDWLFVAERTPRACAGERL